MNNADVSAFSVAAENYALLSQFYATHFQLLDEGDLARWGETLASTFAASFPGVGESLTKARYMEREKADCEAAVASGAVLRRMITNLCIDGAAGAELQVEVYIQTICTRNGESRLVKSDRVRDAVLATAAVWPVISYREHLTGAATSNRFPWDE